MRETDRHMTEDELLSAIADALAITGRRWHHDRRSDLALQQGTPGFPDILAVIGDTLLAYELKTATGQLDHAQGAWQRAMSGVRRVEARVIRPADLDQVLERIVRDLGRLQ
jgi:hypothetical protein